MAVSKRRKGQGQEERESYLITVCTFVQPQEETLAGMVPGQTVAWGMQERRPL
jgi:hypothetical protein